jgi:hypothetical protein
MTAVSSSNYRWRVGEVEITRVLEFEAALFEPTVLYPEASPEIIKRHRTWLEPTLMDPTRADACGASSRMNDILRPLHTAGAENWG